VKLISGRPTFIDPASSECFSVARDWLDECLKHHPLCLTDYIVSGAGVSFGQSSLGTLFPTRTIDVGPLDGSQEPFLSVHSQGDEVPQWATLSHCWGGRTPKKTTRANFDEMKDAIPMATLPAVFQDAIVITRNLNLRHLWVDSLCIIQDCPDDIGREILHMSIIYKQAVLNIAADASENCHDAILKLRPLEYSPIEIPFTSFRHGISGSLFIRPRLHDLQRIIHYDSTLGFRAWALQEAMLSPRTLRYCKQQMLWECRTICSAESDLTPTSVPRPGETKFEDWSMYKSFLIPFRTATDGTGADKGLETMYMRWYSVIENYTFRNITMPEDRLPALAGLAASFQTLLGGPYHAGLFGYDLHRGLQWQTRDALTAKYPKAYRAPSWSWASVDSPVEYKFLRIRGYFRVRHAEVLYITARPRNGQDTALSDERSLSDGQSQTTHFRTNPPMPTEKPTLYRTSAETAGADAAEGFIPSHFGQLRAGLLILRGPWRNATAWELCKASEKNLELRNKTAEEEEEAIFCIFDIANSQLMAERACMRENFGFLHISSTHSGNKEISHGMVHTLILEKTEKEDLWKRVGIAFVNVHKIEGATEGWEQRTVWIL